MTVPEPALRVPEREPMQVIIVGGGPAGLTAGYELTKLAIRCVVLEKDQIVGGLAKTVNYKGCSFDIGGHRFFTKVQAVEDLWHKVLSDSEFPRRRRLSRVYFRKTFFDYPLRLANAVSGLGVVNSLLCAFSYIAAQIRPRRPERTFEDWVTNRFGSRLYHTFFKTYTEKVWGIPCNELSADWAAQRIKGLSLLSAIRNALGLGNTREKKKVIKTLIDSFHYPVKGPGMMWDRFAELIERQGGQVRRGEAVERLRCSADRVEFVETSGALGSKKIAGTHFISSMPARDLVLKLDPPPPPEVLRAAEMLRYRDFLVVALILNKEHAFADNWIYVHDSSVIVGRIQNFKSWSPAMVSDPNITCLGMEYFCFEGDQLWSMSDLDLVELASRELVQLGLAKPEDIVDGTVIRVEKAYPVYDATYQDALSVIRAYLDRFDNLQLVGRNGMHKYNNQDHSMLTAMLAVKNILGAKIDLWKVNADPEYHEHMKAHEPDYEEDLRRLALTQPAVPTRICDAVSGSRGDTEDQSRQRLISGELRG